MRREMNRTACSALGGLLLLFVCASARAQDCQPGELRVIVKDSQEAPIYDAKVRLESTSVEAGLQSTPASGVAEFQNISCGAWTVKASKAGFSDSSANVEITGNPPVQITLTMNPQANRSSMDVSEAAPAPVEQSSSENYELHPAEVKDLPSKPLTISDALPLVPGVFRTPDGELKLDGSGEQRSSLVVNESDVTDPATGKFGQTIPVDSVETMNVLSTPFLAQYGRFTQTVVAVETRRGGDKWHYDLNDPFPDFRIRSYHMRGVANWGPHVVVGGPIVKDRLFIISALQYYMDKTPNRTLPFPFNISKHERVNSFTQIDYILSQRQIINLTAHFNPEHTNYVNPDYFNPEPVSPSYAQQAYAGTLAHHLGLWGGTLDTSISYQRFHTYIGAQGTGDEIITPAGNRGNFFGVQSRNALRREWLEIWSPSPVRFFGPHQIKVGTSLTVSSDHGVFNYNAVQILNAAGQLLQRIDFLNQGPYKRTDLEFTGYVQDHWSLSSTLSVDVGIRVEHQRLAESLRIAPRAGLSWTPFPKRRTVIRTGYGQFYDHIPLDVYAFSRYPIRTVTNYAPDGSVTSQEQVTNVIDTVNGPRSFLVHGQRVAGAFSPRGLTWNAQVEQIFSKLFRMRAVYTDNRSVGLIVLHSDRPDRPDQNVLEGSGESRYRQLELTGRFAWKDEQQIVLSYVHSRAEGNQNTFDNYVGNYAEPFVRPTSYASLSGDLPNRFLMWGHVKIPFQNFQLYPTVEYRNGLPYTTFDVGQNYVGVPYSHQFPRFFSADARLSRDFKVTKEYTVRLSVTGYNLTNHFNALAIHNNIADPQYGTFFGNYHRRYRFDFEVVF